MFDDTDDLTDADTDWLANSVFGYGIGYSKEQALREMARHTHPNAAETVEVDLVEHVGAAEFGMGGWRVERFVSGERVEIPVAEMERLTEAAINADARTVDALEAADVTADLNKPASVRGD